MKTFKTISVVVSLKNRDKNLLEKIVPRFCKPSSLYHDCSMRRLHQLLAIRPALHLSTGMV